MRGKGFADSVQIEVWNNLYLGSAKPRAIDDGRMVRRV
jgi:hypothetical protein